MGIAVRGDNHIFFLWYNVVHIMYGIDNVGHIHKWTVVSPNCI
jgi:hypothetical protein